jgi:probable addiction module antidote protein
MKRQLPRATAFNATKYRNNPKLIAKYLNDALATDDSAFITGAIGNLARAHEMGAIAEEANVDRAGLYRSFRGDMYRIRDSFEGVPALVFSWWQVGRRLVELGAEGKEMEGKCPGTLDD